MNPTLLLDHVVIRVRDLATARQDYTALGFTVIPGGEHPGRGSRNALIAFADGSYIELIVFKGGSDPAGSKEARALALSAAGRSPSDCRMQAWEAADEGLVDFALLPAGIGEVIASARERGLEIAGPFPGARARPDGQQVAWQFGVPDGYDLPFLCADVTPRSLRVPEGDARRHANGATGIAEITVAVRDLAFSSLRYQALLDAEPRDAPRPEEEECRCVAFAVGPTMIVLAQPAGAGGIAQENLAARGEGPFELRLRTEGRARPGWLDGRLAHGARIYCGA